MTETITENAIWINNILWPYSCIKLECIFFLLLLLPLFLFFLLSGFSEIGSENEILMKDNKKEKNSWNKWSLNAHKNENKQMKKIEIGMMKIKAYEWGTFYIFYRCHVPVFVSCCLCILYYSPTPPYIYRYILSLSFSSSQTTARHINIKTTDCFTLIIFFFFLNCTDVSVMT